MLPLIDTYERRARELLAPDVYDYFAGGSGEEVSLDEAPAAWAALRFRPRVLRDVSVIDTSTSVLGTSVAAPVLAAPVGFLHLVYPDGAPETARGAAAAGSLFVHSARSAGPAARIGAGGGPWWQQVYLLRDRGATERVVAEAVDAGAAALVLTADTPYVGAKKRGGGRALPLPELAREVAAEQDPAASFADIGWLAAGSGLPVVVKGVLRGDDARRCVDAGAAAVIVSNHGGRQLDRAVPAAAALAEVAAAVGDAAEVYADGGIRGGLDVLAALAWGARAVLVGRPLVWGLAADGAAGVTAVLRGIGAELAAALALAGCAGVAEVGADLLARWEPGEPTR